MNKQMGIIILVVGIVLLIYGINAADSVASDFSRVFNGGPTQKSILLMSGGVLLTALGAFTVFQGGRK